MKQPFLSVVISAFNEENRLPNTLEQIVDFLGQQNYSSEIIIVDDGSTDKTKNFKFPKLKHPITNSLILHHATNKGKGAGLRTGVKSATGSYILFSDADNSTPIEELNNLLPFLCEKLPAKTTLLEQATANGTFDIAIGSRHLPESNIKIHQPWHRRLLSRTANLLIQIILLPGIIDTQCGFKLFKADVAKNIFYGSTIDRWGFDIEILFIARKLGYTIKEVPVTWMNSPHSRVRPIKGALSTLKELVQIRINGWRNRYKKGA
ncbi:glycosyltransferase family 2 protein [Patescibacteria group bacterium]|nr:glycosyltransferase family 2 protein [Patescibacteria group bacterium]